MMEMNEMIALLVVGVFYLSIGSILVVYTYRQGYTNAQRDITNAIERNPSGIIGYLYAKGLQRILLTPKADSNSTNGGE